MFLAGNKRQRNRKEQTEKYNCKPRIKVAAAAKLSIAVGQSSHGATIPLPSFTVKKRSTAGIVISSLVPLGQ